MPQFRNLYENAWETYRRLLPGAGPDGRDPGPEDADQPVLFLSADLPFATPQEVSAFVRQGLAAGCDYALGLSTEESMRDFYPERPGEPGIRMAYFNLREGRFRQSNLHLVKPARLGNRHYIEDLYEHRYQRQIGEMVKLGWTLLRAEGGGFAVIYYYALMHLAGVADRRGWRWIADLLRYRIPMPRIERGCSALLRTQFRFIVTEGGGCAVDIDNEADFDAATALFERWRARQIARVEARYGPLPLAASGARGRRIAMSVADAVAAARRTAGDRSRLAIARRARSARRGSRALPAGPAHQRRRGARPGGSARGLSRARADARGPHRGRVPRRRASRRVLARDRRGIARTERSRVSRSS